MRPRIAKTIWGVGNGRIDLKISYKAIVITTVVFLQG